MPPKRYFDDERSAKPGVISKELRAALDLHDDKLPIWIYKMRVLGYPPGWLKQADISSSSLQLFDDSTQAHTSSSQVEEAAFNPECFVEFPGFNAPLPEGVEDHCEYLGMPPMQVWQQLNYVKMTIPPPKPVPYKRIKLAAKNDSEKSSRDNSILSIKDEDDEIEIIEPANSSEHNKSLEQEVLEVEREEGEATDSDDDVIAIDYVPRPSKVQKKRHNSNTNTPTEFVPQFYGSQNSKQSNILILDSSDSSNKNLTSTPGKPVKRKSSENNGIHSAEKSKDTNGSAQSPQDRSQSDELIVKSPSVKLIGMGCPIPANMDSKKPPLEKFAVGMGELIYFENLPTSTGVFDKMRNVIFKVREKLAE